MTCAATDPRLRCQKHRRCQACMERDGLYRDGLTKQNSSSLVATLFGVVRRGKR